MDWSSLDSVAELRPYREGDRDAVLSFSCTSPGLNFTRDAQRVIRSAPDLVGEVADDEVWIQVDPIPWTVTKIRGPLQFGVVCVWVATSLASR